MDYLNYYGDPRATLCHFNPNHDPRNGQFARKVGGAIQRYKQNRTPSDDYKRYTELRKRNPKSLTNEELEYVNRRHELQDKFAPKKHKSAARQAAEAELARFATKAILSAAVLAAAGAGAMYLKKKYNINMETISKAAVKASGKFASTVATETAKAVKEAMPTVSQTAKSAASAAGKTATEALTRLGEKEVKAVTSVVSSAKTAATKAASTAADAAGDALSRIGDKEVQAVNAATAAVKGAASNAGKSATDALTRLGEKEVKAVEAGMEFLGKMFRKGG